MKSNPSCRITGYWKMKLRPWERRQCSRCGQSGRFSQAVLGISVEWHHSLLKRDLFHEIFTRNYLEMVRSMAGTWHLKTDVLPSRKKCIKSWIRTAALWFMARPLAELLAEWWWCETWTLEYMKEEGPVSTTVPNHVWELSFEYIFLVPGWCFV